METKPTWSERIKAYKKISGFFGPTPYVWRPFVDLNHLVFVDRCDADGGLVVDKSPASIGRHLGHTMTRPVVFSWWEIILIWIRVIR